MLQRAVSYLLRDTKKAEMIVGLLLFMLLAGLAGTSAFEPFESLFLDFRFLIRGARPFPETVPIIAIDERSLDHPKSGSWPWTREKHAQLLYALNTAENRPRAIGYDFLFQDEYPHEKAGDDSFVYRAEEFRGDVVFAYYFEKGFATRFERQPKREKRLREFLVPAPLSVLSEAEKFDKVSLPFQELSGAGSLGFTNIRREKDGRSRRMKLLARYRDGLYPSLDLMLVLRYFGIPLNEVEVSRGSIAFGKGPKRRVIPIDPNGDMWIDFYGTPKQFPNVYPFTKVILADRAFPDRETKTMFRSFKDGATFVGVTAASLKNSHSTPFDPNTADVFLHAQAVANILENRFLTRAPGWVSTLMLCVICMLVVWGVHVLKISRALLAGLLLGFGYFGVSFLLFLKGVWIEVAVQELAILVLLIGMLAFRYFTALEELKRAQSDLVHSERMAAFGQVSSGMAHEFRNILHAIRLHVEGCARPGLSADRIRRYMGVIFRVMTNADMILNGILSFSRKSETEKKPGQMRQTITNTLLLVKREMMQHKIRIKTEFGDVPEISYDAGQISQVILNLLNNARDALKENKEKVIILKLKSEGSGIRLDIADNGPGIPEEVKRHLFEPFLTTKGEGKGTGLGLSVCHGILRRHGGDLTVTSVPGQGTVWHIDLPKN